MKHDPRKAIVIFAQKMEERLLENDEEKGATGWLNEGCTVRYLHDSLTEKLSQARQAMNDCSIYDLDKRCVDIANFAMMISDRLRGR